MGKEIKTKTPNGISVVVGGIIEDVKNITTKKGDAMVFMRIADYTDNIEVVIFPRVFEEFKEILVLENCVAIKGKFSRRNGEPSLIADKIKIISSGK